MSLCPRINFYRPHHSLHPTEAPQGSKGHRHRYNRSLYETCLLCLVRHAHNMIPFINKLPEQILCDFYGTLHQCNRSSPDRSYALTLSNQLSDISLLNRLLNAEHRRSILYGPLQFLCLESPAFPSSLVSLFQQLMQRDTGQESADTGQGPPQSQESAEHWVLSGLRLGKVMQEMGWYRPASDVIRSVLVLLQPSGSQRHKELFVDAGSRLMHCLSCDCNFSEARELETQCLQLIEELSSQQTDIPNLAVIYARLAALNDILCNYSVAKQWALRALECVSLQLPIKSIVFVFGQASKCCIVAKRFKKSEAIARGAVNIASIYCGTSDPVYSDALMHLGYCNLSIDLTSAAVTCFQRAHTIRAEIYGETCVQSAYCHEDLAYSLYVKNYLDGFFQDALDHAELSISTFLQSLGDDHLITASARRVKALIQEEIAIDSKDDNKRCQLLEEALLLHMGSLRLTMKAFGEDSVPTAKHYGNLGRLYQSLNKFKEAEGYHRDAIRIKEKHLGPDDYEVGLSVGHLAALYCYDMAEYRKAEALYFRSIQIGLKLFGDGFSGLEFDYRGLIHLYKKTRDYQSQHKFITMFDEYRFKRNLVSEKGATSEDTEPLTLLDTLEVLQSEAQADTEQTMDTSESILNIIVSQN